MVVGVMVGDILYDQVLFNVIASVVTINYIHRVVDAVSFIYNS